MTIAKNITAIWLALSCLLSAPAALAAEAVKVLAAGSLTGAMTAVIKRYQETSGQLVNAEFGPAGLLLERIENGEYADIFASANMAHPQTLADRGMATPPVVMLRNRLCAKALPEFGLTSENLLQRMLDPAVGIGTSTPKADPGGDYTWLMFHRADKIVPGAEAILQAKAQQLVGGKINPVVPAGQNAMQYYFEQHKIHISIGYCSSRQTTPDPKFSTVELPGELAVTADYGLSVLTLKSGVAEAKENKQQKAEHTAAYRFALYLLSPEAQAIMSQYGFMAQKIPSTTNP